MQPIRRRALAALALLVVAVGGVGVTASSTSAWFTATRTSAAEVTGATLSIGEIGAEDRLTVAVVDVQPMTDDQAASGARSEWITVRNTGTVALDWALQIVNPEPGATITAAQLANFRFRLYDSSGVPIDTPLTLGAQPRTPVFGAALARGTALAGGASTRIEIRAWLSTDSGNEFQGAGAAFDVVLNAIQGAGGRPAPAPLTLTTTRSGTPSGSSTDLAWSDATGEVAAAGLTGAPVYTVERATRADFADAAVVYRGADRSAVDGTTASRPRTVAAGTTDSITRYEQGRTNSCLLSAAGAVACETNTSWPLASASGGFASIGGALAGERVIALVPGSPTCAVTADGDLYCWPAHERTGGTPVPVKAESGALAGRDVASVVVGDTDSAGACALTTDGQVSCWGRTQPMTDAEIAVPTSMMTGALAGATVTDLARNRYVTCALTTTGTAACWGSNNYSGLGNGSTDTNAITTTPVAVGVPSAVSASQRLTAISASSAAVCGVTAEGRVACWGHFFSGIRLGAVPKVFSSDVRTGANRITDIETLDAGYCVVSAGRAFCAGVNTGGSLGVGAPVVTSSIGYEDRMFIPDPSTVRMDQTRVTGVLGSSTIVDISTGINGFRSCARTSDGRVACWGMPGGRSADASPTAFVGGIPAPTAQCADSAVLRTDGACSLPVDATLHYRVRYSTVAAPDWTSPLASAVRS